MEKMVWARDLPLLLGEVYAKQGARLPPEEDQRFVDVTEWLLRIPSRYPRRVNFSPELRNKVLTSYELAGIRRLVKAMQSGRDLKPFLGDRTRAIRDRIQERKTRKAQNDLFFSDWGLHHFHLGADLANRGRVQRTGRVLVAHLTETVAYLLDVVPHGKGFADTWGQKNLLEILQSNWPETIEKHELRGRCEPAWAHEPNALELLRLREAGINVPLIISGKVYFGPGMGIAADGSSENAVRLTDIMQDELDQGEAAFLAQENPAHYLLYVGADASVGYFVPESLKACCVFPGQADSARINGFFRRLIEETGMFDKSQEGSYWTAQAPQGGS